MFNRRAQVLVSVAITAAVAAIGIPMSGIATADDGGRPFRLVMSGAEEFNASGAPVNPHGDADRGSIELRVNVGQAEVCWTVGELTLTAGDALPHVAHIHRAASGVAGPIVVDLFGGNAPVPAPTSYPTATACVPGARSVLQEILRDPAAYYVNLHNAQHPAGVMRAQLG
jgi:hypothetical protein